MNPPDADDHGHWGPAAPALDDPPTSTALSPRAAPEPEGEPSIRRSGAILLLIALVVAVGFTVFRDRLPYPLQPTPGGAAVAVVSPSSSARIGRDVHPPTPSPIESPEPNVASPTPSPTATPKVTPRPTPRPTATPRPEPTSNRFAVLRRCSGVANCWIYVVRSGDNLFSIAHWFGVSLDSIYAMNPWVRSSGLRAGQELRLPTPTR